MRPCPLKDQVWKHGSMHYKIIKLLSDGSMMVLERNGSRGRWSSGAIKLTADDFDHLEFVKGPTADTGPEEEIIPKTIFNRTVKRASRYVITYAQNATPVHTDFFKSLKSYCEANNAELVIIPGRYKNATSIWSKGNKHDEWWEMCLHPFLLGKRHKLTESLTVYGDISIQPTAVRPLTGMEVFTGKSSAIFGHPKIQLNTVATNSRRSKLMMTTGSCTIRNYTNSKAGKKAAAHHIFGATIIEISKDVGFHTRQINANSSDGTFIDLKWLYTPEGRVEAPPAEALVLGDVHADAVNEDALEASFEMINELQCKRAIYHDILNFGTRNHHSINDFKDRYVRATTQSAEDIVEHELDLTIGVIESTPVCAKPIVIQSNHDEAFDRWLDTADIKVDPINSLLYHKMWVAKLEEYNKNKRWITAFKLYYDIKGYTRARFVERDEDCPVMDIECGYHGDKGINGSRGTSLSYAKLGVKTVVGHRHTPSILDGCYTVGVIGKLDQGYNDLPSSWAHANCVIYANGKRSLLFISPDTGEWKRND